MGVFQLGPAAVPVPVRIAAHPVDHVHVLVRSRIVDGHRLAVGIVRIEVAAARVHLDRVLGQRPPRIERLARYNLVRIAVRLQPIVLPRATGLPGTRDGCQTTRPIRPPYADRRETPHPVSQPRCSSLSLAPSSAQLRSTSALQPPVAVRVLPALATCAGSVCCWAPKRCHRYSKCAELTRG